MLLSFNPCPAEPGLYRVDPDQLASSESALFVIKYSNLYEQLGSSTLIQAEN